MAQEVFEYSDFSGGDYGRTENWRAPRNSFSAVNMLVSRTGELCVRPGVRLAGVTGVGTGAVWGIGTLPDEPGAIWYGQGTAIKMFNPSADTAAVATATGSLTGTPASRVHTAENGTTTYIATETVHGYSFDGSAITSLSNMPNSKAIALYGTRLAVVPVSATNTVQFSADSSFNDWTIAADHAVSITVGDSDPIRALVAQRDHLAVMKQSSSLYVVTGTPGTSEALRKARRFDGPLLSYSAGSTRSDDRIWFAPSNSQIIAMFDGDSVQMFDNFPLSASSATVTRSIVPLRDDDQSGVAFVVDANNTLGTSNEVWLRTRGIWTRHTFGVGITTLAAGCSHPYPQDGDADVSRLRYGTKLVFSDGGSASATPNFWTWMPFMDRPGLEVNPLAAIDSTAASAERAGDASTASVSGSVLLAEQRQRDGREIQVRGVIVDFRSWNTGSSSTNHFDVTVNTLNSYESVGPISSVTASFDEAPSLSALAGSVRSKYFSFGDQGRGSAFNVQFDNCRGIAIQRVRIVTETFPPRI